MSRTMNEVQQEYARAAAELGDLDFKRSLSEDEIEKLDYQINKRRSQMLSLSNEAKKISEELSKAEVALPVEPNKESA